MNNDGIGFLGAGTSDNRLAGKDLQHNRQTRTADEAPHEHRIVRQQREGGGPMKEHMEKHMHEGHHMHHGHEGHKGSGMQHHLEMEKHRHEQAKEHMNHHLERHHKRHHDSQHGHDHHKHHYDHM